MLKCTIGKDGKPYYFLNGKRVKNPNSNSVNNVVKTSTVSISSNSSSSTPLVITFLLIDKINFCAIKQSTRITKFNVLETEALQKQKEIVEEQEDKFRKRCVNYGDDSFCSFKDKGSRDFSKLRNVGIIGKTNTRTLTIFCLKDKTIDIDKVEWF